ncbi:MAG TPA: formylglycine-generating enzyme family protein [Longimicrobiales bacterium]|nr:formylglycine-generating enzyme family protein [Longimicrobiales bacterium]
MLSAIVLLLSLLVAAPSAAGQEGAGARNDRPAGTASPPAVVTVPGGSYRPLRSGQAAPMEVDAFRLDRTPVTVEDFLAFVHADSAWRKDAAPPALVGEHYLSDWSGPVSPATGPSDRPVTDVSWFAARAYCQARGGRLPTTDEWEYAARIPPAAWSGSPRELNRLFLALHDGRPRAGVLPPVETAWANALGIRGLHGLVQEWTDDFNNQMASGAGRDDRGLDRGLFCAAGSVGVSDPSDYSGFLRAAYRAALSGTDGGPLLGFRCAYDSDTTIP